MSLRLEAPQGFPNDDIYEKLIAMGLDRSDREARQAVAALVLLLINQIDNLSLVYEAIDMARTLPSGGREAV